MSTDNDDGGAALRLVPGRSCGSCTMCCKLTKIEVLNKPAGEWCKHCKPGKGCTIYDTRPQPCRQFFCAWMTMKGLDDEWKPTQSKMVVAAHGKSGVTVHVDPSRPDAWKANPFHASFRHWVKNEGMSVMIAVGNRYYAVLPDRDVDLGTLAEDEIVLLEERKMPYGVELTPVKVRKDDPRAQAFLQRQGVKREP